MKSRVIESSVGLFMLAAVVAFLVLAFKVSGLTLHHSENTYHISAGFDNIGSLKIRAPVTVAGVKIGQVNRIVLDPKTFKNIPEDSQASVVTAGLLGANYIEITPGFEDAVLHDGGQIDDTQPALQLETMIGQLLFNINKDKKDS